MVELDVQIGEDEGWTAEKGPEPEGWRSMRIVGACSDLERLIVLTTAASALFTDLPDMASPELESALEDWARNPNRTLPCMICGCTPFSPSRTASLWITVGSRRTRWNWSGSPPECDAYRIEESSSPDFSETTVLAELTDGGSLITASRRYRRSGVLSRDLVEPGCGRIAK